MNKIKKYKINFCKYWHFLRATSFLDQPRFLPFPSLPWLICRLPPTPFYGTMHQSATSHSTVGGCWYIVTGISLDLFAMWFPKNRSRLIGGGGDKYYAPSSYFQPTVALFVLLLSTLVCYQPTELIWGFFSILQVCGYCQWYGRSTSVLEWGIGWVLGAHLIVFFLLFYLFFTLDSCGIFFFLLTPSLRWDLSGSSKWCRIRVPSPGRVPTKWSGGGGVKNEMGPSFLIKE